jgi:hypothetical protein
MSQFEISHSEERLTLTLPPPAGRMTFGFLLLFFTLMFLMPIGILGVMQAAESTDRTHPITRATEGLDFTDPQTNHFGFLWMIGFGLVVLALPLYAFRIYRSAIVYQFDRASNRFTRGGKLIAPLRRVEGVRLRQVEDADDRPLYKMAVVHSDGFEAEIGEWYDYEETHAVAQEIASWTRTRLVESLHPISLPDPLHPLLPRDQ